VINERGYHAATFQAIAQRAGLSRPTMHYYFSTREEVYDSLLHEACTLIADCIAEAQCEDTLLKQLSSFYEAANRLDFADRSMMRFIVAARMEAHRTPDDREGGSPVVAAVDAFYASIVADAIVRGEIPAVTDAAAVVNMLLALFWGAVFYAGFVDKPEDGSAMHGIAKQLRILFVRGLLDAPERPPAPVLETHAAPGRAACRNSFSRETPDSSALRSQYPDRRG
jgi:AcrR family transcriptional regulator